MTNVQCSQAFRAYTPPESASNKEMITIDTRVDSNTGQHFILWKDIQRVFKNAEYVRNGDSAVSFLTDETFEDILPLRIRHYPEVVLEVVSLKNEAPTLEASHCMAMATAIAKTDNDSSLHTVVNIPTTNEPSDKNPAALSESINLEENSWNHLFKQLQDSLLQAIYGQVVESSNVKEMNEALDDHLNNLHTEVKKNQNIQDEILRVQKEIHQMQQEILEKQQQTLDRLAIIQSRIQTVITQTYELHEYPIPRLFIVLPKSTRFRDKLTGPFTQQYRLFFLCECGSHTMSEGSKTPHQIHLAKHEGYDIEKPSEFFEKWGSYVLAMLQMIKFGFVIASTIVPPLALFDVEGIDSLQRNLDFTTGKISNLVDDTINMLEGISNVNQEEMTPEQNEIDKLKLLEGVDLRQLQSYLKTKDEDRILGNLFRIVTDEGHVKWVCFDHYHENYRQSDIQHLRDVLEVNSGLLLEEEGAVLISVASRLLGKQLYDALVKACGVHCLVVEPAWDVTLDDLRTLASIITTANINSLSILGGNFTGPVLDIMNRSRRYDPIFELVSNRRVQTMCLLKFPDLLNRMTGAGIVRSPQLRKLVIETGRSIQYGWPKLKKLLDNIPGIVDLEVETSYFSELTDYLTANFSSFHRLEITRIRHLEGLKDKNSNLVIIFSKGTLKMASGTIYVAGKNAIEDGWSLLMNGHFIRLFSPGLRQEKRYSSVVPQGDIEIVVFIESIGTPFSDRKVAIRAKVNELGARPHSSLLDMFQEFGWCVFQVGGIELNSQYAISLNKSISIRGSVLVAVELNITAMTSEGIEAMCNIIECSPNMMILGLIFVAFDHPEAATAIAKFLSKHVNIITKLELLDTQFSNAWLMMLEGLYCNPHDLKALNGFNIRASKKEKLPGSSIQWIADLISAPPSVHHSAESELPSVLLSAESEPLSIPQSAELEPLSVPHSAESEQDFASRSTDHMKERRGLKLIELCNFQLDDNDWATIVDALDFSELTYLSLIHSNFSLKQFRHLVNSLPDNDIEDSKLESINLKYTPLEVEGTPSEDLHNLCYKLIEKAPNVKILATIYNYNSAMSQLRDGKSARWWNLVSLAVMIRKADEKNIPELKAGRPCKSFIMDNDQFSNGKLRTLRNDQ
ncbi:hypothetical protein BGZ76_007595 [Entomortierella beljakovae]|nr:hypothetical protein BGZ76_007595 [Entomortierella beljakovae]